MRRVFAWSIPLVLIGIGLLWPLVIRGESEALPADEPVVISNYRAAFVVNANGRLDAVETITAEFPGGRHGIFRYWDVANPNSPYVRQEPEITSVMLDGEDAPYRMLWVDNGRFRVAKIGDPDEYLSFGTHVFEIRYTVPGVLEPGSSGADRKFAESTGDASSSPSVFFWNVITPSWNNRIQQAAISVTLPGDVSGAQCSVGYGVGSPCRGLTVTGNKVELSASYLGSRTPVTVRAGVDAPTPGTCGTAVALHLGSDPRPVVERPGVDPESDGGGGARRFSLETHHGRGVARVPAAIRAAARPWARADRIHSHRDPFRRMPSPRRFSIWPNEE